MERITLNDGTQIPAIGFGTFQIPADGSTYTAVQEALKVGYRHIDTAAAYFNEEEVGRAIADSGIPRNQVFLTSKLWLQDYDDAKVGVERSLRKLGTHIDLYLIHQPYGNVPAAWQVLENYRRKGDIRSIGVSNMTPTLWEAFIPQFDTLPAVNQIKLNPLYQQLDTRAIINSAGVRTEAWGPLGQGDANVIKNPVIAEIAVKHGKDNGQVILRWAVQHGIIVLPKSANPARIASNLNIFDFELDADDMAAIDALDEGAGKPHMHDNPDLSQMMMKAFKIED
ncbi:MAG: aldo/keto reductase [Propionibacteriaceae bacterium]|nr:aldo/keto reductase [Propionibacteriaceae bacterium]